MQYRHGNIITRGRFLILIAAMSFVGCSKSDEPNPALAADIEFRADGVLDFFHPDSSLVARIAIEIAESGADQATGLMYRRSLPDRGGMLFIDQTPSMRSFWMKNTALSLDIIFLEENGDIVNIVKNTTPYSEAFILSTEPAQYVVEVRAGFTDRYHISEEDHVTWERRSF
jgi:uncharacterized protein